MLSQSLWKGEVLSFPVQTSNNKCDHSMNRIPVNNLFKGGETDFGTKLNYLKVNEDKLKKLISRLKLKAPKAKLTGILTTLTCYSYHRACLINEVNDIPLDSIQYDNLVSIRPKFGNENTQMGVFSDCLECRFDIFDNYDKIDFW